MKISLFIIFYGLFGVVSNINNNDANTYIPLSQGSSWTYAKIESNDTTYSYDLVYGDSIVNNQLYTKLCGNSSKFPHNEVGLLRKSNDTIYSFERRKERIFLVERNGAVWRDTLRGYHQYITITNTVIDDSISYELDNIFYNPVLHIQQLRTSYELYNDDSTITKEDLYYAKNIGLLEIKGKNKFKLKQFDIK